MTARLIVTRLVMRKCHLGILAQQKLKRNKLKKLLTSLIFILSASYACAYETCLITADGKLTDISIENNDIIDVCPIFTVMNEKNTLLVRPLKEGETRFCVLKNNKDKIMLTVKVEADKTTIDDVDGFDILGIDEPPEEYEFELDEPPSQMEN